VEAERAIPRMSPDTTVLLNRTPIVPAGLTRNGATYPPLLTIVSQIDEVAREVHVVDGTALARQAGNLRLLTTVMVGALAGIGLLPMPASSLAAAVERGRSATDAAPSRQAFGFGEELGRELAASNRLTGVSEPRPSTLTGPDGAQASSSTQT